MDVQFVTLYRPIKHAWIKRQPIGLVCLTREVPQGDIGMGLAMCSIKDNFTYKVGKGIALNRAIRALDTKTSTEPVNFFTVLFENSEMTKAHLDALNIPVQNSKSTYISAETVRGLQEWVTVIKKFWNMGEQK